ncbi:MAG: fimbrial protein [Nitratireductor sp.]
MTNKKPIEDEKPLDPETEKVRKKLAKYGAIFMGFNMLALMAVLGALVYKLGGFGEEKNADPKMQIEQNASAPMEGDSTLEDEIALPVGAKIKNASMAENRILLNLELANGQSALWIYEQYSKRIIKKIAIK